MSSTPLSFESLKSPLYQLLKTRTFAPRASKYPAAFNANAGGRVSATGSAAKIAMKTTRAGTHLGAGPRRTTLVTRGDLTLEHDPHHDLQLPRRPHTVH